MASMLSALSLLFLAASAAPSGPPGYHHHHGSGSGQVPFKFPLPNGFPNIKPGSSQLLAIEKQAHGTLPNSPLPTSLTTASATTFQAIAFGELFEVAYFTTLLNNITSHKPGFEVGGRFSQETVVEALLAVQAQEELHALGVNGILQSAGRTPVQPCEYIFPVDNFDSAIATAAAFTDAVVLGGLQDALNTFATDGDTEVVGLLTSVVGQEGEQNGFYRLIEGNIPSALPFLTRSTGPFAFSFINQNFIVPGSCPTKIDVPIFSPLKLDTPVVHPTNQELQFSVAHNGTQSVSGLSLVYINQQNLPIVESISNVHTSDNEITFSASFPYEQNLMNGLTIAVLTKGHGPFATADDVAAATVFGPAIIEIN